MKSESKLRVVLSGLYLAVIGRLFLAWLYSFRDPKERADKFSFLLQQLSAAVTHQGKKAPSPGVMEELVRMRYATEIAAIKKSVVALSTAAYEDDPYLYTECTKVALTQVFHGMGRARAMLLAWLEENPAFQYHNHVSSSVNIMCRCDSCIEKVKSILAELHTEAGSSLMRMNSELQFKLENPLSTGNGETLQ